MQRLQRLEDDAERRRYLPALVADGHVGGRFAR